MHPVPVKATCPIPVQTTCLESQRAPYSQRSTPGASPEELRALSHLGVPLQALGVVQQASQLGAGMDALEHDLRWAHGPLRIAAQPQVGT